jgi:hypothetical protein
MSDLEATIRGLLWAATMVGEPTPYAVAEKHGYTARVLESAGVPAVALADAYRTKTDTVETVAMKAVKDWGFCPIERDPWEPQSDLLVPRESGLIGLFGLPGCGKSAAVATLMRWRVDAGARAGQWFDCRGLGSRDTRKGKPRDTEGKQKRTLAEELSEEPWLVLDDVGAESARSKYADDMIAEVLGKRCDRKLPTAVTANLYMPGSKVPAGHEHLRFEDAVGARVASRLQQWGEIVDCGGDDLRESVKAIDKLPEPIRRANRLVALVRRLGGVDWNAPGPVDPRVLALTRVECRDQLSKILRIGLSRALEMAEEAERTRLASIDAFEQAMARIGGKPAPKPVDLDAARRAHEGKVAKLRKAER